jgi:hypothetical protein
MPNEDHEQKELKKLKKSIARNRILLLITHLPRVGA